MTGSTTHGRGPLLVSEARAIAENVSDSIVIMKAVRDPSGAVVDWTYVDANDGALRILGKPRARVLGALVSDLLPGFREKRTDERMARVLASGEACRYETQLGGRAYLVTIFRIDEDTVASGALDVSEWRRAEQAQREGEVRLRLALKAARMIAWELDPATKRVTLSDNYEGTLAVGAGHVHERSAPGEALIHPDDVERHRALVSEAVERGTGYVSVYRQVGDRGEVLWVEERAQAMVDASGRTVRLVGVSQNVTDRKTADDALARTTERLTDVLKSIQDDFYVLDREWRFTFASRNFTSRIGKEPSDFVGRCIWTMFPKHLGTPFEENLRAAMERNETRRFEIRGQYTDAWYRMTVFPSKEGVTVLGVEISESKRLEAELQALNARLVEADRRKDEFLATLSHELRNPLAPIRNALYILDRAEPGGQQAHRAKEVANRQVAHLARLVDDLLDVTRIARGKVELRRANLDLAALAQRIAEDHRTLMEERGLELLVEVPARPVVVNGDEVRLGQVLGNLLSNAAKFTPPGGRVTLSIAEDPRGAVIHVRDTGPGIAPELLDVIFDPFTQAKQTLARTEGGLGLGLALVKGLVALHDGEVAARNAGDGGGADFVVTLPLVARAAGGAREP